MNSSTRDNAIRLIGWLLIVFTWVAGAYVLAHATLVTFVGPGRLYETLGQPLYNSLIAGGGLSLLIGVALWTLVTAIPFGLAFALSSVLLKRLTRLPLHFLDASALVAAGFVVCLHVFSIDGWPTWAYTMLWGDDTEFASDYSAWGFWRITEGTTRTEVIAAVGEPLERQTEPDDPGAGWWYWTRSPHDDSYRIRAVKFSGERVAKKIGEFYLD